jgi:predicted ATPase
MNRIRIKYFGPVKEGLLINDCWLDVKKVTVFIGNQGSGKSTVAKLISTFMWLEKALNRGEFSEMNGNDIRTTVAWQGINKYFKAETEIEYVGDKFSISYIPAKTAWPVVRAVNNDTQYLVPKIMYVPAERNFTSAVRAVFDISELSGPLKEFAKELRMAHYALPEGRITIPFLNIDFWFDRENELSYIVGKDYTVDISESASGQQSAVPLYILSNHLARKINNEGDPAKVKLSANRSIKRDNEVAQIMMNSNYDIGQKNSMVAEIYAKYHSTCFINIIEEPEQNLFPTAQKQLLFSLLEYNNILTGNKLIMTTHSPYLINYLTLAIEAGNLLRKIRDAEKESSFPENVYRLVPKESTVNAGDVAIYEMDEISGTISLLAKYNGLPSDENKLNNELGAGNEMFAALLEIEQMI